MRRNVSTAQPTSIDNSTTAEKLAEKADYLIHIEDFKTPKRLRALISTAMVALKTDISTNIPVRDAEAATAYTRREREERTHGTSKPCAAIMANGLPFPVTTAATHSSQSNSCFPCSHLYHVGIASPQAGPKAWLVYTSLSVTQLICLMPFLFCLFACFLFANTVTHAHDEEKTNM